MSPSQDDRTRRRRRWFAAITVGGMIVSTLVMIEVVARLSGARPMPIEHYLFKVEQIDAQGRVLPVDQVANSFKVNRPHTVLGYTHIPGRFQVTLSDDYAFRMTQGEDTLRITRPPDVDAAADTRPPLWIFGCSFTHGWSVNDDDTFPWHVQQAFPAYNVVNFGTGGYGPLHSLLQFEQAIESRPAPRLAVVTYAHFHDERNTFNRAYRKVTVAHMAAGMRGAQFPYARVGPDYVLTIDRRPAIYHGLPLLKTLAAANFLDDLLARLNDRLIRSHDVSKALIREIDRQCRSHDVELVVAGITQEPATWDLLADCVRHEIRQVDISFDYGNPRYMNAPHDPQHPSPAGQRIFAERLVKYLKEFP